MHLPLHVEVLQIKANVCNTSRELLLCSAEAGSISCTCPCRCSTHGLGADVLKVLLNSLHPDPNCRATAKQLLALP